LFNARPQGSQSHALGGLFWTVERYPAIKFKYNVCHTDPHQPIEKGRS
jgi:hypothetical protein